MSEQPNNTNFSPLEAADDELQKAIRATEGLDDNALANRIGRRTSVATRVLTIIIIAGVLGLGIFAYQRDQRAKHRWDAWTAAQQAPSQEAFLSQIRTELEHTEFDDVRERIIEKLGVLKDLESVPTLTRLLDEKGVIRAHAARALSRIGAPGADSAKTKLLAVLPTTDEADRAPVVWALTVLGEGQASDAIVEEFTKGTLQGQPGFDPHLVTTALGVARLSRPELTGHAELSVRTLVAQALAEAATPDVIDPLTNMLRAAMSTAGQDLPREQAEARDNVIRQVVSGLGRASDPRATQPLFELLTRMPNMKAAVLDALRRSTSARGIAVLLQGAQGEIRKDLVAMLRQSHDPNAAEALTSVLADADTSIRLIAASGLAELGDARAVPTLVELSEVPETDTARSALEMLRLVPAGELAPRIAAMLSKEELLPRRSAAMRALGHSQNQAVGAELMRYLAGDDREAAAIALAELNYEPAFGQLLRALPRPRNVDFSTPSVANEEIFMNRRAAVHALGRYGRADAAPALMAVIDDPQDDIRLRADAGLALGSCSNEQVLGQVIAKVRDANLDPSAKRSYLGALWQKPSRPLSSMLLGLMVDASTPSDVKTPLAIALGYAADPQNDARLIELLAQATSAREAGIAIGLGGSEAAASALVEKLASDNELRDILQELFMNQENDWFNLITDELWTSGQIHRRIIAAQILNDGKGEAKFGFAWTQFVRRLVNGWDGVDGLSAVAIRQRIYADLTGSDASKRVLSAQILGAMNELGLLMAARDSNGPGADEARRQLLNINQR